MREYYSWPADAYELCVESRYECMQPEVLSHKASRHRGSGGMAKITTSKPLFRGGWGESANDVMLRPCRGRASDRAANDTDVDGDAMSDDDGPATSSVVLGNFGASQAEEIPVLLLPFPIATLIFKGSWAKLVLLIRWHASLHSHAERRPLGPIPDWPPPGALVWDQVGGVCSIMHDGELDPFTPDTLANVSDAIRNWSRIREIDLQNHGQQTVACSGVQSRNMSITLPVAFGVCLAMFV
jgi:hypothetical protein